MKISIGIFGSKPIAASIAALLVLISIIAAVVHHQNHKFWQDFHPTLATLRTEGTNAISQDLSNSVVGMSRIIEIHVGFADSVWRGKATYEFVNDVGGVERTIRLYVFDTLTNSDGGIMDIIAHEDPDQARLEQMAASGDHGAIESLRRLGISRP